MLVYVSFSNEYDSTYNNGRSTALIVHDLNVLEGSSSTARGDLETLEDSLLGRPLAGEAGLRVRGLATVINLLLSEVALDEGLVLDVDGVDALNVYTRAAVARRVDLEQ
jgi:hypothetical protein